MLKIKCINWKQTFFVWWWLTYHHAWNEHQNFVINHLTCVFLRAINNTQNIELQKQMEHKKYHREINSTKAPKNYKTSLISYVTYYNNIDNTSLDLLHVALYLNATNNTDYSWSHGYSSSWSLSYGCRTPNRSLSQELSGKKLCWCFQKSWIQCISWILWNWI